MAAFDFDLFVIGAGSGGVRAARIAAGHGAKVAIAEEYRFGGTCVIRGCVPKKLLVYASRFRDDIEDAAGYGWSIPQASFDWATLIANKDREIDRLEQAYLTTLGNAGVETIRARATVTGPHSITIAGRAAPVTARVILVATGGHTDRDSSIQGIEHAITSNEAFHLPSLPRRIAIVGSGYIAVEFAGIFHGLGSEVSLVIRGPKILRGFDEDLRDGLTEAYSSRGIEIVTNERIAAIAPRDGHGSHRVTLHGGRTLDVDAVMLAVGRSPSTAGLGLEAAGVALGRRGEVIVDRASQSSVASIYAVGDVTDRVALTPVAIREGHAFADSVFGGRPTIVDHATIPTAVFSTPEIGTVGLSEQAARAQSLDVEIYKSTFRPMRNTLAGRNERMLMKLVVDKPSGRMLGVHILGPDAAEIVQIAAIPLRMGATKADFDATMALHPSAAEELVTMRTPWRAPAA